MEYRITFEIPDELDAIIEDIHRKWVAEKIATMLREIILNEVSNGVDRKMLDIKPVLSAVDPLKQTDASQT